MYIVMKVNIKKLDSLAQVPKYANDSDAGMDLVAISKEETPDYVEYGTGLAVEIPEGYVGLIFPRSSISKQNLALANSVGVIDSGYRGEIKFRFKKLRNQRLETQHQWHIDDDWKIYHVSDKIGQLIIIPYPKVEFSVVDELSNSERGNNGFGSSGK